MAMKENLSPRRNWGEGKSSPSVKLFASATTTYVVTWPQQREKL